jgi:hypothetical protein
MQSSSAREIPSRLVTDVNEELVRRWFELRGYFVRTNLPYRHRTANGVGWSDVDICALHPHTNDAVALEVKGWHTEAISPSYISRNPELFQFLREEATAAITDVFGREDFRRMLVVGRIGPQKRDEVIAFAQARGVEMLEFTPILEELIAGTPTNRSAGSDVEHAIRVLKTYGFVALRGSGAPASRENER